MQTFNRSRRIVSFLFLVFVGGYFLVNAVFQSAPISASLRQISFANGISGASSQMEQILSDNAFGRFDFINLHSYVQVLLDKEESGDFDIVKSQAGALTYGSFFAWVPDGLEEYAIRLSRLKAYASQYECNVIFLTAMPLYITGYSQFTDGMFYKDMNPTMDTMLYYLQGYGVDYLDVRQALRQTSLALEKYRYQTDHHWTIEASFETFRILMEKMEREYGAKPDPQGLFTDINHYRQIVYRDSYAGSLARRTGIPFAGREDFTLILPAFPTYYSVEKVTGGEPLRKQGVFDSTLIDPAYLNSFDMYHCYMGGLAPLWRITNLNDNDGMRILVIGDSFTLPLSAFMAACAGQVDIVYPLGESMFGYGVDIDEYVKEHVGEYDFIIVQLDPNNYTDQGFPFFKEPLDAEDNAL